MLTKESLLSKGLSPEVADEILSAMSETKDDNSLTALRKALEPKDKTGLFKAEKENEEDNESGKGEPDDEKKEDYDEKYMKKHMKKYMVENKKECRKAADEAELYDKEMKKAIDSIDMDADGAVVEMADLSPVLEAIVNSNTAMLKAINTLVAQNERITDQNEKSFEILHKAAAVTAETADSISGYMGAPQGRKGVTTGDMAKARATQSGLDPKSVYRVLAKAMTAGDQKAAGILEVFESSGKRVNYLNAERQAYVADLLSKEA